MQPLSRAKLLAAFLSGNTSRPCCPRCLTGFADRLVVAARPDIDRLLIAAQPFWTACVAVILKLSGNNIEEHREMLETAMARCTRSHPAPVMCTTAGRDAGQVVVDAACHCLQAGLLKGTQPADDRAQAEPAAFETAAGYWPTKAAQVFPTGDPTGLLRALVHWGGVLASGSPLCAICGLAAIARPLVFDAIMSSPELHTALVNVILEHLRTGQPAAATELDRPLSARSPAWTARAQRILSASALLNVIENGPDGGANDVLILLQPRAQDAFSAVLDALAFIGTDNVGHRALAQVANRLQQFLKLPVASLPWEALQHRTDMREFDVFTIALCTIGYLRVKRKRWCSGPGCGRFVHHLAPGSILRPCAGCGIVNYCSGECEQRYVQHGQVCSLIRPLADINSAGAVFQGYSVEQRKIVINWAVSHEVLSWKLKERARVLLTPRVTVTGFLFGIRV